MESYLDNRRQMVEISGKIFSLIININLRHPIMPGGEWSSGAACLCMDNLIYFQFSAITVGRHNLVRGRWGLGSIKAHLNIFIFIAEEIESPLVQSLMGFYRLESFVPVASYVVLRLSQLFQLGFK